MSNELAKGPSDQLFGGTTTFDEARAILRSAGMSAEDIEKLDVAGLRRAVQKAQIAVIDRRNAREAIALAVARGELTEADAAAMSWDEKVAFADLRGQIDTFRFVVDHARAQQQTAVPRQLPEAADAISRNEVLSLVGEVVAVVAALAEENRQLRAELAEAKNAQIAVFGKHALVDQIIKAERDIEGFEVSIELEEQASTRSEVETSGSSESATGITNARDTRAAIEGLAKHVVGLDVSRTVNFQDLDRTVKRMKERAAQESKVRSRGHVHMKFGKVSGGKKHDQG